MRHHKGQNITKGTLGTAVTYSELPCDSIKTNMYGVFKIRGWRNFWSLFVSVLLPSTWK